MFKLEQIVIHDSVLNFKHLTDKYANEPIEKII